MTRVQIFNDKVVKTFRLGQKAQLDNEVKILKYLEEKGCDFVPKIIEVVDNAITMTRLPGTQTNIGQARVDEVYSRLEQYDVVHNDEWVGNILFSLEHGKFYIVDFEHAEIIHHV